MITGGQITCALIFMIFQKSLKSSPKARSQGQTQVAGKYTRGNNVSDQLKTIPSTNFVLWLANETT